MSLFPNDYAWTRRCAVCGREYAVTHANVRKTCSPECERAARSAASKGRIPANRLDVTGQRYGELTALRRMPDGRWLFRCPCGAEIARPLRYVRNNKKVVSCGHVHTAKILSRLAEMHKAETVDGTRPPQLERIAASKPRTNNTSGVTGVRVRHNAGADTYEARIVLRGRTIRLGTYKTLNEAAEARKKAEATYWEPEIRAWRADHGEDGR